MDNRILSFVEFNSLYESYGFINEAEEVVPDFSPKKMGVTDADLDLLMGGSIEEDLDVNQFAIIKMGEKSDRVKQLQKDLGMKNVDGIFGKETFDAVKKFQSDNKITVDGKVGVQTLRKMLEVKGIKDTKTQDDTIKKTYIKVTTKDQAQSLGLDPAMLDMFEALWLVKNGTQTYVIGIPKKDAASMVEKAKKDKTWSGLEFLYEAGKAVGKAIVYTATGFAIVALDVAKAIISAVGGACKFVASGIAYVVGATLQGLIQVKKWADKVTLKAYKAVANFTQSAMETMALWAGKSLEAMTAVYSIFQAVGFTLTGIAITAWRKVKKALDPAVQAIIQDYNDVKQIVKAGMDEIAKAGAAAVTKFKNTMKQAFNDIKNYTINAYDAIASKAKKLGGAVQASVEQAYKNTLDFFSEMYEIGKAYWESFAYNSDDPIYENLVW